MKLFDLSPFVIPECFCRGSMMLVEDNLDSRLRGNDRVIKMTMTWLLFGDKTDNMINEINEALAA